MARARGSMTCGSRWLLLTFLSRCLAQGDWGKTIDVAGRQRMLTQRMSKEFLQVSLDIDRDANIGKMRGSINLYNVTLFQLINGDAESGVIGTPNALVGDGLAGVLALWIPFAQLLLDNVETVRDASGFVDMAVLTEVAGANVPLLVQSNVVVGRLVDAAKSAGAPTNGLVVDTAGRQRMLIQRMCKEALLISQGVSVEANVGNLKNSQLLFLNSHIGIVEGATWAGVPVLSKLCTMHQMREVTFNFQEFSPLLNQILNTETAADSQNVALSLAKDISDKSVPLFSSMVAAVSLYVNDQGLCEPSAAMTYQDWQSLLLDTNRLVKLEQEAQRFYLQIGNDVVAANSQVGLVVTLNTIISTINNLVQGNKGLGVLAPPNQAALNSLLVVKSQYNELFAAYEPAVTSQAAVTLVEVSRILRLSVVYARALQEIVVSYESQAIQVDMAVPIHTILTLQNQTSRATEMTVLANLIAYGKDVQTSSTALNSTRDAFITEHFALLTGKAATNDYPAIQQVQDICVIRKMREAYVAFVHMEREAQDASLPALNRLASDVAEVDSKYAEVTTFLQQGTIECSNRSYTLPEWENLIRVVGSVRSVSQEACADYILATQGQEQVFQENSQISLAALEAAFRTLAYGSDTLPAPPSQAAVNQVLTSVKPAYDAFLVALASANTMNVVQQTDNIAIQSVAIKDLYFAEAQRVLSSFPVGRLAAALDQAYRVNRMVKLSFMFIYQITATTTTLQQSIDEFDATHIQMKDGGGNIPAIIDQRQDLLDQWDVVDRNWQTLKSYLLTQSVADVPNIQAVRLVLLEEINILVDLFSVPDQAVAETFPWMFVAYGTMGLFLLVCACGAIYIHWASKRKRQENQAGWNQA